MKKLLTLILLISAFGTACSQITLNFVPRDSGIVCCAYYEMRGPIFLPDSNRLRLDAYKAFDTIVKVMNKNPIIEFEIVASPNSEKTGHHTTLGDKRAEFVLMYLKKLEVDLNRIVTKGLADCTDCPKENLPYDYIRFRFIKWY